MAKTNEPTIHQGKLDAILTNIALEHTMFETLERRGNDRDDFTDTAVWCMKAALEEAFRQGMKFGAKGGF